MNALKITTTDIINAGKIERKDISYLCGEIAETVKNQQLSVSFLLEAISEQEILCTAAIKGRISFECSCCLESFDLPVDLKIKSLYQANAEELDLEDEIKQSIILGLPVKPVCGASCLGLCPQCGKNLNKGKCGCVMQKTDSRWEKLKGFIK